MEEREITAMIARLIEREGGYVDHPADRGGPTKYGITMATLQSWRSRPVAAADVRDLSIAEATDIYRKRYVEHRQMRIDQWPYRRLAEVTLDASIMFGDGPALAVRWAQEAINAQGGNVKVDGWAGPQTWAAMALRNEAALVAYVVGARCRHHARVVAARPGQSVFLEGWINRATAWVMAGPHAVPIASPAPEPVAGPPAAEHPGWPGKWPLSARRWVVRRQRHNLAGIEYWTGLHVGLQSQCNPVVSLDPSKAERWIDEAAALAAVRFYDDRMLGHGFNPHQLEEWGE